MQTHTRNLVPADGAAQAQQCETYLEVWSKLILNLIVQTNELEGLDAEPKLSLVVWCMGHNSGVQRKRLQLTISS